MEHDIPIDNIGILGPAQVFGKIVPSILGSGLAVDARRCGIAQPGRAHHFLEQLILPVLVQGVDVHPLPVDGHLEHVGGLVLGGVLGEQQLLGLLIGHAGGLQPCQLLEALNGVPGILPRLAVYLVVAQIVQGMKPPLDPVGLLPLGAVFHGVAVNLNILVQQPALLLGGEASVAAK